MSASKFNARFRHLEHAEARRPQSCAWTDMRAMCLTASAHVNFVKSSFSNSLLLPCLYFPIATPK
jgi:hypothetical protein